MPWENIGSCGTSGACDWRAFQVEMAAAFVLMVCGQPPPGCEVGPMGHDHEMGEYATMGLCWQLPEVPCPPWDYIRRAQLALRVFDDAIEWGDLNPDLVRELFPQEEETDD